MKKTVLMGLVIFIMLSVGLLPVEAAGTIDTFPLPIGGEEQTGDDTEAEEQETALGEDGLPVLRSGEVNLVSAYALKDHLYAFVNMDEDINPYSFRAGLINSDVDSDTAAKFDSLRGNVHYVFLMDVSDSMEKYRSVIRDYITGIMDTETSNAYYSLATFGEKFAVVQERMTDGDGLIEAFENLEYKERATDMYDGIMEGLDWTKNYDRNGSDVVILVMITDGKLWIQDKDHEGAMAEAAQKAILETPEVIVSTVCVEKWNEEAKKVLQSGRGQHIYVDDRKMANHAGESFAKWIDNLYYAEFRLESKIQDRFSIKMILEGGKFYDGSIVIDVPYPHMDYVPMLTESSVSETTDPTKTEADDGEGKKDSTETTEQTKERNDSEESLLPTQKEQDDIEADEKNEKRHDDDEEEDEERTSFLLPVVIALGVVVVIVSVLVIVMANKKSKKVMSKVFQSSPGAIPLQLEVYAGQCLAPVATLYLTEQMTIGSAEDADLRFADSDVSAIHARILIKNGQVYIEDTRTSVSGVALDGMRISGQNPLRSGNLISLGTAEFTLRF